MTGTIEPGVAMAVLDIQSFKISITFGGHSINHSLVDQGLAGNHPLGFPSITWESPPTGTKTSLYSLRKLYTIPYLLHEK